MTKPTKILAGLVTAELIVCVFLASALLRRDTELSRLRTEQAHSAVSSRGGSGGRVAQTAIVAPAAGNAAPQAPEAPAPKKTTSVPKVLLRADVIRDHPEYEALSNKEARRYMLARVGDLIERLNLSAADTAKLKDRLVDEFQSPADAQELARSLGVQEGTPEYAAIFQKVQKEVDDNIKQIVGEEGYQKVMLMPVTLNYRNEITNSYGVDFRDGSAQLSEEQTQRLAEAMTATLGRPNNKAYSATSVSETTGLRPAEEDLLKQAGEFLTTTQVDILRQRRIEDNQRAAIMSHYPPGTIVSP